MDKLTAKQQAFVREYIVDNNGTQAAIRAGYSPNGAEVSAHRLLRHARVAAEVRKGQAKLADRTALDVEWVLNKLHEEARGAVSDASRIRATELIGKHIGMFVERHETGGPGEFSNLTEEELEDRGRARCLDHSRRPHEGEARAPGSPVRARLRDPRGQSPPRCQHADVLGFTPHSSRSPSPCTCGPVPLHARSGWRSCRLRLCPAIPWRFRTHWHPRCCTTCALA